MSGMVPSTRCFEGDPCGFSEDISPEHCQASMAASYDIFALSPDAAEIADASRCPFAVSRWLIYKTPPEALRRLVELIDSDPDEPL